MCHPAGLLISASACKAVAVESRSDHGTAGKRIATIPPWGCACPCSQRTAESGWGCSRQWRIKSRQSGAAVALVVIVGLVCVNRHRGIRRGLDGYDDAIPFQGRQRLGLDRPEGNKSCRGAAAFRVGCGIVSMIGVPQWNACYVRCVRVSMARVSERRRRGVNEAGVGPKSRELAGLE